MFLSVTDNFKEKRIDVPQTFWGSKVEYMGDGLIPVFFHSLKLKFFFLETILYTLVNIVIGVLELKLIRDNYVFLGDRG